MHKVLTVWLASQLNTDTPTIAREMPRIIKRWNGFSAAEPSESTAYIQLNRQTPCPPRSAVPVNQGCRISSFTHGIQFAFGHGGDHPNYARPV